MVLYTMLTQSLPFDRDLSRCPRWVLGNDDQSCVMCVFFMCAGLLFSSAAVSCIQVEPCALRGRGSKPLSRESFGARRFPVRSSSSCVAQRWHCCHLPARTSPFLCRALLSCAPCHCTCTSWPNTFTFLLQCAMSLRVHRLTEYLQIPVVLHCS